MFDGADVVYNRVSSFFVFIIAFLLPIVFVAVILIPGVAVFLI